MGTVALTKSNFNLALRSFPQSNTKQDLGAVSLVPKFQWQGGSRVEWWGAQILGSGEAEMEEPCPCHMFQLRNLKSRLQCPTEPWSPDL